MYRQHLFWFYSPPSFKVMRIREIVLIQVNINLFCSCLLAKKWLLPPTLKVSLVSSLCPSGVISLTGHLHGHLSLLNPLHNCVPSRAEPTAVDGVSCY